MVWLEITQYKGKQVMMIKNLVETTWITKYTWPTEITNDWGSEFMGHGFKTALSRINMKLNLRRDHLGIQLLMWY